MTLLQNSTVCRYGYTCNFQATGGVEPYVYSVAASGAGGSINSSGVYTAPDVPSANGTGAPIQKFDTIQVTDANADVVTAQILILTPLELVCEIIAQQLGLANGQVMIYNQKWNVPQDSKLYVTLEVLNPKPFGNSNKSEIVNGVLCEVQSVNFSTMLQIDLWSRSTLALERKEEVIMALRSQYADRLMSAYSFWIAPITSTFVNLSSSDGAAIPYRFNLAVNVQYAVQKVKAVDYFDEVTAEAYTDPETENEPIVVWPEPEEED